MNIFHTHMISHSITLLFLISHELFEISCENNWLDCALWLFSVCFSHGLFTGVGKTVSICCLARYIVASVFCTSKTFFEGVRIT